jgi:hypothetical protein
VRCADKHSEGSTSGAGNRGKPAVVGAVKGLLRGLATVGLVAAAGAAAAMVGSAAAPLPPCPARRLALLARRLGRRHTAAGCTH